MHQPIHQRLLKAPLALALVAALLLATFPAAMLTADVSAAPTAQQTRAKTVTGSLDGGQFAKIWLGLEPDFPEADIRVESEWDVASPRESRVGFYVLDTNGLSDVLGGSKAEDVDLATAEPIFERPDNVVGAQFTAFGLSSYTIVVYNDGPAPASFTLRVENATITDDSNQVTDPSAPVVAEDTDEDADADAGDETDAAPAAATTAVTTTVTTTATATTDTAAAATTTTADTATDTTTDAEVVPSLTPGQAAVVRSETMSGDLPEQGDQHFLALEPNGRDVEINLTLEINPSDNSVLARRLNFWVMDDFGFNRYLAGDRPSDVAIAAGNRVFDGLANERQASFKSVGSSAYTILIYNNAPVAGNYVLSVTGGTLVDDSLQTLTAQAQVSSTSVSTDTASAGATTTTTGTTTAPAASAAPATTTTTTTSSRDGEPGGTYTVQSGDTVSLIARDIYGNVNLYNQICAFNGLDNCDRVEIGDELRLPTLAQIEDLGDDPTPVTTTADSDDDADADEEAMADDDATADDEAMADADADEAMDDEAMDDEAMDEEATDDTDEADDDSSAAAPAAGGDDIIDVAEAAGNFDLLVAAIEAANLTDALRSAGPFTVFAPTDEAFSNLPEETLQALLADPAGQLTDILLYHVVPGRVTAEDLQDNSNVQTVEGSTVSFTVDGDTITINDATIVTADIEASNGVIHVIDAVISPPASDE